MDPLALFLSPSGRLAPRPFAIAVLLVYIAGFVSQALLAPSVLARTGLSSFAVVQAFVMWMWLSLHTKRLHDADRGIGTAVGIAIVCSLAILLFILVVAVFQQAASAEPNDASGFIGLVTIVYLFTIISGNADFGALGAVLAALVLLAISPFLIALGFSIWTATRPSAPGPASSAVPAAGA
jgi:uncharacterized membrane protein YhaH (DUF805 family)